MCKTLSIFTIILNWLKWFLPSSPPQNFLDENLCFEKEELLCLPLRVMVKLRYFLFLVTLLFCAKLEMLSVYVWVWVAPLCGFMFLHPCVYLCRVGPGRQRSPLVEWPEGISFMKSDNIQATPSSLFYKSSLTLINEVEAGREPVSQARWERKSCGLCWEMKLWWREAR